MSFDLNKSPGNADPSLKRFDLSKNDGKPEPLGKPARRPYTWIIIVAALVILLGAWAIFSGNRPPDSGVASSAAPKDIPAPDAATIDENQNNKEKVLPAAVFTDSPVQQDAVASAAADRQHNNSGIVALSFKKGASGMEQLNEDTVSGIVKYLELHPEAGVIISGYASSEGSAAFNQALSEKRAKTFQAYLVSKGVKADRIHTVGRGTDNPLLPNNTEEGRQHNRRVEIVYR